MKRLCFGCMEPYDSQFDVCPYCGYIQNTPPKEAYHITPGLTLYERYLVGKVLGSGGFGITYIGYDLILTKKVAIKEYFPVELATRMPAQTKVTVYAGEKLEQFTEGMKKALDEGKRLAEFRQVKGITQILDFFEENGTAYIVMELLEGETLKDRLKRQEKMPVEEALPIILAVADALSQVHAKNIIHRDIAPDNIYLLSDGTVKLLDFGASRQVVAARSKSLTVILKMGYAPVEQYQSNGNQGPWTDVYGLAATFYRMITGKRPPEAQERRLKDTVKEPSKLGVQIDKSIENALMNALNVQVEDRTQSAEEFGNQLRSSKVERHGASGTGKRNNQWPMWLKAVCIAGAAVAVAGGVMAAGVWRPQLGGMEAGFGLADNVVYAPNLVNLSQDSAKALAEERELVFEVARLEASDVILEGYVLRQTNEEDQRISPGDELEKGSVIRVVISSGTDKVTIPDLLWMDGEEAVGQLKSLGLLMVNTVEEKETWAPKGVVTEILADGEPLKVDGEADAEVEENVAITLKVAAGDGDAGSGETAVPDLAGLREDEAYDRLKEAGLFLEKEGMEHSSAVPRGQVIRQQPEAGANASRGGLVKVAVSAGARKVQMADVRNMEEEEAVSILEDLGLAASVERRVDPAVEMGRVISQSVEPGIVDEGTEVTLVISQGPPSGLNSSVGPEASRTSPPSTTAPRTQPPATQPETTRPPETTTQPPTTAPPRTTAAPRDTTAAPANDFWHWRESMQQSDSPRTEVTAAPETRPAETEPAVETQPAETEPAPETRPTETEPVAETRPAGTEPAAETQPPPPETQPSTAAEPPASSDVDFWRWRETAE